MMIKTIYQALFKNPETEPLTALRDVRTKQGKLSKILDKNDEFTLVLEKKSQSLK